MALSRRPAARRRQLANLRNAPPAPAGNRRALKHGGTARVLPDRLDAKVREVFDALAASAPLREAGELPQADVALVTLLAKALCRLEDVERWLDDYGTRDVESGEQRSSILDLERRLRQEAADHLDALGMSPRSRARLGLDLARAEDALAAHLAEHYGGNGQ